MVKAYELSATPSDPLDEPDICPGRRYEPTPLK